MQYEIVDLLRELCELREEMQLLREEVTSYANLVEDLIVNPPEDAFDDCAY